MTSHLDDLPQLLLVNVKFEIVLNCCNRGALLLCTIFESSEIDLQTHRAMVTPIVLSMYGCIDNQR